MTTRPLRWNRRSLRRLRFMLRHPRFMWWATDNWLHGRQFDYMARCRWCDHTTPHHYSTCRETSS